MPLKLISLNIQGSYHFDKWIPFILKEKPDVLCLQEVFQKDFEMIKKKLGMSGKLFLTSNKTVKSVKKINEVLARANTQPGGLEGVAILTNLPCTIEGYFYVGEGKVPEFDLFAQKDRVLVYTTVEKDDTKFSIATTHFTWSVNGSYDDNQMNALKSLLEFDFSDIIFCGDLNAPRGGEVYKQLVRHFKDNIPEDIDSTLDSKIHRKTDLKLVVDYIFTTPNYKVEEIKVVEGVSDHKAVVALIKHV